MSKVVATFLVKFTSLMINVVDTPVSASKDLAFKYESTCSPGPVILLNTIVLSCVNIKSVNGIVVDNKNGIRINLAGIFGLFPYIVTDGFPFESIFLLGISAQIKPFFVDAKVLVDWFDTCQSVQFL